MSASALDWPALQGLESDPSGEIAAERAVLGKVHGAASDFRWIALSPGFDTLLRPEAETSTGLENLPLEGGLWRSVEERCYAVRCYKSRALDRAGRSAALEKQFLAWAPLPGIPRALAALLLLERVQQYDDSDWWSERRLDQWRDPSFSLQLPPVRLAWDADRLTRAVEEALARLRESCPRRSVSDFYARLLSGSRPALLEGAARPLPAAALAALLLPWPRPQADSLSLAGWIFSSRYDPESIARRWSGAACQRRPRHFSAGETPPSALHQERAQAWSGALWENAPQRIPRLPQPASPSRPPAAAAPPQPLPEAVRMIERDGGWEEVLPYLKGLPAPLQRLVEFSLQKDCWWLAPQDLVDGDSGLATCGFQSPQMRLLRACLQRLEREAPHSLSPKGWAVKADLLRAACLALCPAPETLQSVGWPRTSLVPPLIFAPLLRRSDWPDLAQLGPALQESLKRSGRCPYEDLVKPVEQFMRQWASAQERKSSPT